MPASRPLIVDPLDAYGCLLVTVLHTLPSVACIIKVQLAWHHTVQVVEGGWKDAVDVEVPVDPDRRDRLSADLVHIESTLGAQASTLFAGLPVIEG